MWPVFACSQIWNIHKYTQNNKSTEINGKDDCKTTRQKKKRVVKKHNKSKIRLKSGTKIEIV